MSLPDYLTDPSYLDSLTRHFTADPELHFIGIMWPAPGMSSPPLAQFNDDRTGGTISVPLNEIGMVDYHADESYRKYVRAARARIAAAVEASVLGKAE